MPMLFPFSQPLPCCKRPNNLIAVIKRERGRGIEDGSRGEKRKGSMGSRRRRRFDCIPAIRPIGKPRVTEVSLTVAT